MPHESGPLYGVMEAKGAYNRHAMIPVGGAALAAPFLEKAASQTTLDDHDHAVVIADYGSSQGKNSLAPMAIAIQNVQSRLDRDRPILVFHIDQPSNDFNSLFEALSSDPNRYSLDNANVFPCVIGRSFYEQVLPSASVHLGWCSCGGVAATGALLHSRSFFSGFYYRGRYALHSSDRPPQTGRLSFLVERLRCDRGLD